MASPIRATMSDVIARTRLLIGDVATPQQFLDSDVQDVLDAGRVWVRNAVLRPAPSLTQSGVINYTDYFADMGNWESDVVLQDAHFTTTTDYATADYLTGHWTWTLSAPGKVPPIFITGKFYDIYGAAADLLERWAAVQAQRYDFTSDGQTLRRSQVAASMRDQARMYRKQALVHVLPLTRSDMNDDTSGTNVVVGNTDVMGW